MAVKWAGSLIAVAVLAVFITANVVAARVGAQVPETANLLLIAIALLTVTVTVIAEFHLRTQARLGVLSDFLVNRLENITSRLDKLGAEGPHDLAMSYLTPDPITSDSGSVVPLMARVGRGYPRGVPSADD